MKKYIDRNKKEIVTIILVIVGLTVFGYIFAGYVYFAPTEDEIMIPLAYNENKIASQFPTNSQYKIKNEFIPKLSIPSLNINTRIQYVGINSKGNMSAPSNFVDVGLYKYGPLPGEVGSAVIAGHVVNGLGIKSIFGNLKNIEIGDAVYVEMEQGKRIKFVVSSMSIYDFDAEAGEVFNQNDGAYLKLITCSGKWSRENRTHDKRLVVTAIKSDS